MYESTQEVRRKKYQTYRRYLAKAAVYLKTHLTFGLGQPRTRHLMMADSPAFASSVSSGFHVIRGLDAGRTFSDVEAEGGGAIEGRGKG